MANAIEKFLKQKQLKNDLCENAKQYFRWLLTCIGSESAGNGGQNNACNDEFHIDWCVESAAANVSNWTNNQKLISTG